VKWARRQKTNTKPLTEVHDFVQCNLNECCRFSFGYTNHFHPSQTKQRYIVNRGLDNNINNNQWTVTLPEILTCLCCQGLEMFPPDKVKLYTQYLRVNEMKQWCHKSNASAVARQTDRHVHVQTGKQTQNCWQTERQTEKQMDRDRQTDRQTDGQRWIGRQIQQRETKGD